jgi:methyl-accepting chemotaxis protein
MISIKARFLIAVGMQVFVLALMGFLAVRTAGEERRLVSHIDVARDVQVGLQSALRGAGEMLLTEGTPASRAVVSTGIQLVTDGFVLLVPLADTKPVIDSRTAKPVGASSATVSATTATPVQAVPKPDIKDLVSDWSLLRDLLSQQLAQKKVSADDVATQIRFGKIASNGASLTTQMQGLVQALSTDIASARSRLEAIAVSCALVVILAVSMTAWWVLNGVSRAITQASARAQRLARGDLSAISEKVSQPLPAEMLSLEQALESARLKLGEVSGSVREHAESVATASAQIASGNMDLSNRTEQQAAAVQQARGTLFQFRDAIDFVSHQAHAACELAVGTQSAVARGGQAVNDVSSAMGNIRSNGQQMLGFISEIDGIAFQTNILALNAAVEAARAGEAGRGFAVVASEVRALSQRSAAAAREIKSLIRVTVDSVEAGSQGAELAVTEMNHSSGALVRLKDLMIEIDGASQANRSSVAVTAESLSALDEASQMNASMVEQSATATASLKQQAAELQELVAYFRAR